MSHDKYYRMAVHEESIKLAKFLSAVMGEPMVRIIQEALEDFRDKNLHKIEEMTPK